MRVSAQLYTVRQCGDLADQLRLVAACGFEDIETTGLHELNPQQMAGTIHQSGLNVRSAHFDWEEFDTRFDDIVEVMDLLECQVAVMPWLAPQARPDTARGWMAVSGQLSEWADRLSEHGIRLAYHNHDFDLVGAKGETPLDQVLSQGNIYWQPDIGWLQVAGLDAAAMIKRHADRILSIHAKDADPDCGTGDERWRDLGEGVVDWDAVLKALADSNCSDLFVEHDETLDHRRTLNTGRGFLTERLIGIT
ncbi:MULTISPECIES: sugar phosphate isomerase/epimerase [unclassified Ruegeria]|uniref:sugar phosphate isomerase/epimerase family protein n=1 Tax=unclassified Ruegeria TaxID=2625375 RepID=UPI001492B767|nr:MULTISPECIES: sugar phosphate isomerase/epimerase [unclassified Ruegeria]NOD47472.1 TIM barrel protein [Ruegeria sp. HKCCD5849]NOD53135.1 TIM barrel protein [Ruegeria sp. HKCCD5851]NOD66328.1 TIM barrel protein [Ruegeria sp. HKCCD7303]